MGAVSQTTIAKQLGLTQVAVSKALKGHRDIAPGTIARVRATAQALGYRTNRIASSLANGRTHLIGVLLPSFFDNFLGQLLNGLESEARARGFKILASQWDGSFDTDDHDVNALLQYQIDGLIVFPRLTVPWPRSIYARLLKGDEKIVFVNQAVPLPGAVGLMSDNFSGSRQATAHLIRRGHRHILFACPWPWMSDQGYKTALRDAGLPVRRAYIVRSSLSETSAAAMAALQRHPEVTAVFCLNDTLAVELMDRLTHAGRRVPEDLSVVGYGDDFRHPELQRLPLTTVNQSPTEMGAEAVRRLIALIAGREKPGNHLVSCRLIERDSVANGPSG